MAIITPARAAAAALLLIAGVAPARDPDLARNNRQLNSVHQPVVSRADYSFDAVGDPRGLAPGEAQRLAAWFDGLALSYGDTVTIADPGGWHGDGAYDAVSGVLSRYGMLLANEGAPVNAGPPPANSVRVVVSRASARVPDCPNFSNGNGPDYARHTQSNYGCASAENLAAMIADPQDLVQGARATATVDPNLSVKAVSTWRNADPTGKGGLKAEKLSSSGSK